MNFGSFSIDFFFNFFPDRKVAHVDAFGMSAKNLAHRLRNTYIANL